MTGRPRQGEWRPDRDGGRTGRRDDSARPGRPRDARPDGRRQSAGFDARSSGTGHGPSGDGASRLVIPDSITADQLDPEALAELRTLPGDLAEAVARLLVATSVTEDPERAFAYARQARDLAARVGVVRETCAIAAYQAGDWNAALTEFRAARRLTGRTSYLPPMADCERALGRLDRALDLITSPEAKTADLQTRIELRIVESGIRRDQGLPDAAVVALQIPELTDGRTKPAFARLYYAYADALLAADRPEEAREWFGRAAEADEDGATDAAERCDELDDISLDDLELVTDEDDDPDDNRSVGGDHG